MIRKCFVFRASSVAPSALIMAATVLTYSAGLFIEHYLHQHVDLLVLAVALPVTLARTELGRPSPRPWLPLVLLPIGAAAASWVGEHLARDAHLGDVLFTLTLGGCIWVRRFGPVWSKAGTLTALPFVAALVTPFTPQDALHRAGWSALIAIIAALATGFALHLGNRFRLVPPSTAPTQPRTAGKFVASTRMAAQMVVAVAVSFVIGRNLHPEHWQWPVLTAYIVGSGNQGRGDVIYKSLQRGGGAAIGTVAATLISGRFGAGDKRAVVLIFLVLWLAVILRTLSYAYWAACITAALALVYGYFGQGGRTVLEQRLEGIALGAMAGAAAAFFVLPIRTTDVLRRRTATLFEAVGAALAKTGEHPREAAAAELSSVIAASAAAAQVSKPLTARSRLRRWRAIDLGIAYTAVGATTRALVTLIRSEPELTHNEAVAAARRIAMSNVALARMSLKTHELPDFATLPTVGPNLSAVETQAARAFSDVNQAVENVLRAL